METRTFSVSIGSHFWSKHGLRDLVRSNLHISLKKGALSTTWRAGSFTTPDEETERIGGPRRACSDSGGGHLFESWEFL